MSEIFCYVHMGLHGQLDPSRLHSVLAPCCLLRSLTDLWGVTWWIPGGDLQRLIVRLLHNDMYELTHKIGRVDSAMARCSSAVDRQYLLAVIEASFGTLEPFNKVLREIFAGEHCHRLGEAREEGKARRRQPELAQLIQVEARI